MPIAITGRHITVTPALRHYLEQRVQRLKRYGVQLDDGQFVLSVEKYRHTAEGIVAVNGRRIQGKVATPAMYESIDRLLEKLERQLLKNKDKLVERKQRVRPAASLKGATALPSSRKTVKTIRAPVLRTEEALKRMDTQRIPFLIFQNAMTGRIQVIRRADDGQIEIIEAVPSSSVGHEPPG